MTLEELKRAGAEKSQLDTYAAFQANFANMEVVGVTVRQKGVSGTGITLEYGNCGGGSISSFGFSKEFGRHMTQQLMTWIDHQVEDAKAALAELGVDA